VYPTISDLIFDFTGKYIPLPIQTFGFFVVIGLVVGAYFIGRELKRKENEGLLAIIKRKVVKGKPATITDYVISALTGFIIGFKLLAVFSDYSGFVANPQDFILSTHGSMLGGGIGAGLSAFLKYREKSKESKEGQREVTEEIHPYELIGNIIVIAAIAGFIGAKIFHNLENIDELIADPLYALVAFSGLTYYGGLIVGSIAVLYYTSKNKIHPLHMVDVCAPALILTYGVGRIGCQMSGDGDWGINNLASKPEWMGFLPDWMWSFNYPHNVINEGIRISGCEGKNCFMLENPVFPTPFYETIMAIIIFGILWSLRKKIRIPGVLFCIYLIFNGVERFLIEQIRVNSVYNIFGADITQAEILSVVMIIIGIVGIWYLNRPKTKGYLKSKLVFHES